MMRSNSILEDFKQAFNRSGNIIQQLIIINAIVFVIANLVKLISRDLLFYHLSENISLPSDISGFLYKPWTLATYFFTHYDFFHIFWNMIIFFWFAKLIKEYLGSDKVLVMYILGGLAGGLTILLMYNVVPYYIAKNPSIVIGASAAVFSVIVGAATLLPNHSFNLLLLGQVRIKYIALVVVFLSLINIKGTNAGGELAHLGGALIGFVYIRQLQKGNDIGQWVFSTFTFFKSFFVKQPKMKVNYSNKQKTKAPKGEKKKNTNNNTPSTPDQHEIDAILDKISQSGYESLSKEEKQKLFNASKK